MNGARARRVRAIDAPATGVGVADRLRSLTRDATRPSGPILCIASPGLSRATDAAQPSPTKEGRPLAGTRPRSPS